MSPLSLIAALVFAATPARADRDIVKVNGTTIRQSEVMEKLWQRYGAETLEELVDDLLLRQEIQKRKIKADAAEVERRLGRLREQLPDPKALEAQLQSSGSSIDKLKQELGAQIERERLIIADKKLAVAEDDIKKAFDEHKNELGRAEGLHLRHIMVATEAEAKETLRQLQNGADFQKLAKEKSLAPTGKINGGDYGFVSKGMLPPDIETVAFSMKSGEMKTLPSGKGWHILQALERRPPQPAVYAQVKDDLRELLLQQKIKQVLPDFMRSLREKADIKPQGS
jgi:foldase protein PrsA